MGKRGPKPTPTPLRILKGDRKDRINFNEPTPPPGRPEPPDGLDRVAREEWDRVAPILETMRVLTLADGAALALYCSTFSQWTEATGKVKRMGMVVATEAGGMKLNPYMQIAQEARGAMVRLLAEFGMTPSSRSKVTPTSESESDPLADMIARRKKA